MLTLFLGFAFSLLACVRPESGLVAPTAARKAKRSLDASGSSQGNPDWTRDELIIALDVYLQTAIRSRIVHDRLGSAPELLRFSD